MATRFGGFSGLLGSSNPFQQSRQMGIMGSRIPQLSIEDASTLLPGRPQVVGLDTELDPSKRNLTIPQRPPMTPLRPDNTQQYLDMMLKASGDRPARNAYQSAVAERPTHEEYEPTVMGRILAGITGASAGLNQGAAAGIAAGQNFMNTPYNKAVEDYDRKMEGLKTSAGFESEDVGNKLSAYQMAQRGESDFANREQQFSDRGQQAFETDRSYGQSQEQFRENNRLAQESLKNELTRTNQSAREAIDRRQEAERRSATDEYQAITQRGYYQGILDKGNELNGSDFDNALEMSFGEMLRDSTMRRYVTQNDNPHPGGPSLMLKRDLSPADLDIANKALNQAYNRTLNRMRGGDRGRTIIGGGGGNLSGAATSTGGGGGGVGAGINLADVGGGEPDIPGNINDPRSRIAIIPNDGKGGPASPTTPSTASPTGSGPTAATPLKGKKPGVGGIDPSVPGGQQYELRYTPDGKRGWFPVNSESPQEQTFRDPRSASPFSPPISKSEYDKIIAGQPKATAPNFNEMRKGPGMEGVIFPEETMPAQTTPNAPYQQPEMRGSPFGGGVWKPTTPYRNSVAGPTLGPGESLPPQGAYGHDVGSPTVTSSKGPYGTTTGETKETFRPPQGAYGHPGTSKVTEPFKGSGRGATGDFSWPPKPEGKASSSTATPEEFDSKVKAVAARMEKLGYPVKVISKKRSAQEQAKAFAKGRTAPGKIVTEKSGKPGDESRHQLGTAADFAFINDKGQPDQAEHYPWELLGQIAKEEGLEWGGDWKSLPDRPHVQMRSQGN